MPFRAPMSLHKLFVLTRMLLPSVLTSELVIPKDPN